MNQIHSWIKDFYKKNITYPHTKSGRIAGTDETWGAINIALDKGTRSLPGGTTLAELLQTMSTALTTKRIGKNLLRKKLLILLSSLRANMAHGQR